MVFRIDGFASHVADFLRVFCVSAEAAAAFASLLAVLLRSTFAAVAATFALVVSLLPFCVRADAATDFSSFDAVLLLRTLAAAEATLELVLSDLAALAMGVCSQVAICASAKKVGGLAHLFTTRTSPSIQRRSYCFVAFTVPRLSGTK